MRVLDLVEQVPTVTAATTGAEAARLVAEYRLNGLVVLDDDGLPTAVIPGSQILALVVPGYVRDDPALARAIDEQLADELCQRLASTTVGALLDAEALRPSSVPTLAPDDTLIEVATVMVEAHYPLVVVRDHGGRYLGVVTMSRVLAAVAVLAGQDSSLVQRRLTEDIADRGPALP